MIGLHKITKYLNSLILAALVFLISFPALAHIEEGLVGGFYSGFLHPVLGWGHVFAMVAVGLWGAFLRSPAIYILPIVFPVIMALGGAAGVVGAPLPYIEIGIAFSSIVLGLLIAFAVKSPLWLSSIIVGIFALFHGHAHGTELPQAANAMSFAVGFVIATGLLHLCGIGLGVLVARPTGKIAVQFIGVLIALAGLGFLFDII